MEGGGSWVKIVGRLDVRGFGPNGFGHQYNLSKGRGRVGNYSFITGTFSSDQPFRNTVH